MKSILFIMAVLINPLSFAQTLITLNDCYSRSRENYPLVKQHDLIIKSKAYSVENAAKGYLPQFSVFGQATYQSDVTQIPIANPNIEVLSKDQYRIFGEVTQTLFDGGAIKIQKQVNEVNAIVDDQKLEIELYKLKERINQLYFGVLLVNDQIIQTELLKKDIQSGLTKTHAAIANGIALKSSGDVLQAELLKVEQRVVELKAVRQAYVEMLSLFVNQQLGDSTSFERPQPIVPSQTINRPELQLYDYQKKSIDIQYELVNSRNRPKFGFFLQGGYGRPALNMLNNNFDLYYIGGFRMSWFLFGFYTLKNERELLELNRTTIDLQKETFLFNTNLSIKQQNSEITKLQELIKTDKEIIELRTRIKNTALSQIENGVINSNDYLKEVNAEDQSRLNLLLHETQLLMTSYNQQTTSGNL